MLYEIYTTNTDSFSVGNIILENDKEVLVRAYDDTGRECAIYLIYKDMIKDMLLKTEYLRKIQLYINYWDTRKQHIFSERSVPKFDKQDLLHQIIKYGFDISMMITIQTRDCKESVTGFIESYANKYIIILCIDVDNAEFTGNTEILIDNIWFIEFHSVDNELLGYANRHM